MLYSAWNVVFGLQCIIIKMNLVLIFFGVCHIHVSLLVFRVPYYTHYTLDIVHAFPHWYWWAINKCVFMIWKLKPCIFCEKFKPIIAAQCTIIIVHDMCFFSWHWWSLWKTQIRPFEFCLYSIFKQEKFNKFSSIFSLNFVECV